MTATIFTDGSCYYKTKQGGYGVFIIQNDGLEKSFRKGFSNTTSQRMELMAIIKAFEVSIKNNYSFIKIYSDSEYCVKGFTEGRLLKWKDNDWVGAKNVDLWKKIYHLFMCSDFNFDIRHTRGHQKNIEDPIIYGNSVADILADYKTQKKYYEDRRRRY